MENKTKAQSREEALRPKIDEMKERIKEYEEAILRSVNNENKK